MNEAEVERQIDQMVRFIKQEAEEKANEIGISAEEEFNIEKLQLLENEKSKVKKDYERREGQIEVKKKIEYSKQLNDSRIMILQAREDALQGIVKDVQSKLSQVASNKKKYSSLLTDLILQAAGKLEGEKAVVVFGREEDTAVVKEAAEAAKSKFKQVFKVDAPQITVSTEEYLPSGSKGKSKDDDDVTCAGGVVVKNAAGSIVCSQKLDDRLQIAYSQNLPQIRATLFGTEGPVRSS